MVLSKPYVLALFPNEIWVAADLKTIRLNWDGLCVRCGLDSWDVWGWVCQWGVVLALKVQPYRSNRAKKWRTIP